MSRAPLYGEDTPPIDVHPLHPRESLEHARERFATDAALEGRAVRSRLALEGIAPRTPPPGDGQAQGAYQRRLRAELGMVEVRRLRRLAEWKLAYHARWGAIQDPLDLQRVVARAYSRIGAFFDPQREMFVNIDVERVVRQATSELGLGAYESQHSASIH